MADGAGPELFGIHRSNVPSTMSKNIFTTFFPVATALYLSSKGRPVKYLRVRGGELDIDEILFERAIGVDSADLPRVEWNSEIHPDLFAKSPNAPPMDMVPTLDKEQKLEFEVKLTVVPTFNRKKTTELIVRQNTEFSLAERMAYRHRDLVNVRPITNDTLRGVIRSEDRQLPFILHGLWKTKGTSMVLDETNVTDVYFISDFAYLKMLLDKYDRKPHEASRIGKVVRLIRSWIGCYLESGSMRYKEDRANVEHLKVTIYPTEHQKDLQRSYENLRLPMKDLWNIVPDYSIRKMSPERRLDAAIFVNWMTQTILKREESVESSDGRNLT